VSATTQTALAIMWGCRCISCAHSGQDSAHTVLHTKSIGGLVAVAFVKTRHSLSLAASDETNALTHLVNSSYGVAISAFPRLLPTLDSVGPLRVIVSTQDGHHAYGWNIPNSSVSAHGISPWPSWGYLVSSDFGWMYNFEMATSPSG